MACRALDRLNTECQTEVDFPMHPAFKAVLLEGRALHGLYVHSCVLRE